MKATDAAKYIGHYIDDAGSAEPFDINEQHTWLVGWQCGFEPLFVAVKSYLPGAKLTADEAEEIAVDYLIEVALNKAHVLDGEKPEADHLLEHPAKVFYLKYITGDGTNGEPWEETTGTLEDKREMEREGYTVFTDGEVKPDAAGFHYIGHPMD